MTVGNRRGKVPKVTIYLEQRTKLMHRFVQQIAKTMDEVFEQISE